MAELDNAPPRRSFPARTLGLALLQVLLLAGLIAVFLASHAVGLLAPPEAGESLTLAQPALRPGEIDVSVRNTGAEPLRIAVVNVNDAIWPFKVAPDANLPPGGQGTIHLAYPWIAGETYNISLLTSNSSAFSTSIAGAAATPAAMPASQTLMRLTWIGLYVGVIPVLLSLTGFPSLRRAGLRTFLFLTAAAAGLLIYLGLATANEALRLVSSETGPFQGVGLVGMGGLVTFMLLDAVAGQTADGQPEAAAPLPRSALRAALGIGLHNLAEGLAVGAAYSIGAAWLGTFLVIGFVLQNITEGLSLLGPLMRARPSWLRSALLVVLSGLPAVAGAWVGGLTQAQPLLLLFLAIGAGAVFEVAYEVFKLIHTSGAKSPQPLIVFSGVTAGMLLLYVAGFFIK